MTREEITNSKAYQVSKEALKYYNEHHKDKDINLIDAFEAGFEYADSVNGKELLSITQKTAERTKKEVINGACEWLEKNRDELSRVNTSGFVELFKKAMEL